MRCNSSKEMTDSPTAYNLLVAERDNLLKELNSRRASLNKVLAIAYDDLGGDLIEWDILIALSQEAMEELAHLRYRYAL